MKKIIVVLIAALFVLGGLGCGGEQGGTPAELNIYVPDGAPALAVAKLMKAGEVDGHKLNFSIVNGKVIGAKLTNGEADLAIAPTNLGANLYQKGAEIQLVSVNTYGLLYLIGRKDSGVTELADLKGKLVKVIGQGDTPDLVFQYVLQQAGIPFEVGEAAKAGTVVVQYVADGTTIKKGFQEGLSGFDYGVLGEPAASAAVNDKTAITQVEELFDLQQEFKVASDSETVGYPQAGLFAQQSLLAEEGELIAHILAQLDENTAYLKEHTDEAIAAYRAAGGQSIQALSPAVIDRMNLRVTRAASAQSDLATYLGLLGIAAPADGFYYRAA